VTAIEPAPDELTAVVAAFRTAEEALAAVTANATRLASAAEQLVGARQTVAAGGTVLGDVATALQGRAAGLGAATGELVAAAAAVRAVDRRGSPPRWPQCGAASGCTRCCSSRCCSSRGAAARLTAGGAPAGCPFRKPAAPLAVPGADEYLPAAPRMARVDMADGSVLVERRSAGRWGAPTPGRRVPDVS
jgi:hypothetical protein